MRKTMTDQPTIEEINELIVADIHNIDNTVLIVKNSFHKELQAIARKHNRPFREVKHLAYKTYPQVPQKTYTCWELADEIIGSTDRVLLWGASGTGKSWAARRSGNPEHVYSQSLTEDTPAAELRGHYGLIEGSYKWLDGPCVKAWREGARLVLNELEKASGDAQTFLLGILDDMEIAQQTLPTGETIKPNMGFHVVATMNGKPDEDLNPALRDRFPVCIHINEVAPAALAKLPEELRKVAKNSGIVKQEQRRISIRSWNEFHSLRGILGDEFAASCIFGENAQNVLDSLKIAEYK